MLPVLFTLIQLVAAAPLLTTGEDRTDLPSATDVADAPVAGEASAPNSAPKWLLRYRFQEGDVLRYESKQTVVQSANLGGGTKTTVASVKQRRRFTVKEVNSSGEANMSMQFEKVHMEQIVNDGEPLVFDSAMAKHEVPHLFTQSYERLKRAAPTYTTLPIGTPVDDERYEVPSPTGRPSFVFPLPKNEVAVGDSWKTQLKIKARISQGVMGDFSLLRTFRLVAVKDGIAEIRFSTSMQSPNQAAHVMAQLMQVTPNGKLEFDIAAGRLVRKILTFDQTVRGAMGPGTMNNESGRTEEFLLPPEEKAAQVAASIDEASSNK